MGPDHAEACLVALEKAQIVTFPVLHGDAALRVRLAGHGAAIAAVRNACRGRSSADLALAAPRRDLVPAPRPEPAPSAGPQVGAGDLRQPVIRFLTDQYLAAGPPDRARIAALYGDRVDYFGKAQVANRDVVTDKLNYFRQWPTRVYTPILETVEVRPSAKRSDVFEVSFQYRFRVSGARGERAGKGVAQLMLVAGGGRSFVVVSENGSVLERQ